MLEQIVNILPLYTTNKSAFLHQALELLRQNGATPRSDIDAEPIKDLEGLIKELNQFIVYNDIDVLFAVLHETAVYNTISKV